MISMRQIAVVLSSLVALCCYSQERYQIVIDRNAWLLSGNAAAMTLHRDSVVSLVSISCDHTNGGWHDFSEPERENTVVADARSFMRLSPRVMTFGSVTYCNITGYDEQGTMLYDDGSLKPFDIVDDSLNNAGKKHTEIVGLGGAVGAKVADKLSVGAKMTYDAGTFVKYKDLRHTNTYMRFDATMGACVSDILSGILDMGANAEYRRRTESVEFKTFGTNDVEYKSLVDYANLVGSIETFGADGFTESGKELPLLSEKIGGSVQMNIHVGENIEWYNEVSLLNHQGRYGKETQYSISYAKWDGDEWSYMSDLVYKPDGQMHVLSFSMKEEQLSAKRNVYRQERDEENTSVIYYRYYTPVKMNDKLQRDMHIAYVGRFCKISDYHLWTVKAGVETMFRDFTAYVFPYYCRQKYTVCMPYASLIRRIFMGEQGCLTAELGASVTKATATAFDVERLSDITQEEVSMDRQETYQSQNYEYMTSTQVKCHVALGYLWKMRKVTDVRPSVTLSCDHNRVASCEYVGGRCRRTFALSVGCEF